MALSKWHAYSRLMRIDRPIGSLLLLWPTYWALWIAAQGTPSLHLLIVFTAGVFLMRAAGCVINDFADRNFDGYVERTKHRPLPSGDVTEKEAKILFACLVGFSFLLVLTLNSMTIWLSVAGLALAWIYPFVKRVSNLPQVVLGAAFGWSIPMGFSAVSESLPLVCWLLFLVNIIWSVIYDTQYAMVDRNDDLKIGIKSTAILFGNYDKLIIGLLQVVMVGLLVVIGFLANLGMVYYAALVLTSALFVYQQQLMVNRERAPCFKAFMNNNYVGFILFIGMVISYL
ncbi:4-hydroxybenzoate octaprenyltransferase [Providencia rustigianii]|uniref:4-hydroxybenzoate octaprenyltransferase n=1 Tax=Providencia rustigianii DSM 4541 TaxID=500637 RepID=D1P751_9GAMM|nr:MULTISPECIES: 4-hydroxybenzoate octaprenyltransferase [Providencia]EFB70898.1 4-hydroxybenzoate polyprenyl transferase [Providencia rustigianii DSM 4541]MTC56276.1 4-hydroxybenzoate octaprenyltransferase [Providencia rustigianii]SPY76337.1 4-hydroxybenzoate octaprenyltransferase [Providencia rustigianii]SUC25530.1 4-hydroxybenzoate octaprenyltransferase [Providencia rustigianii]VEB63409.1 4-hydroxybenzoate octaprenyltransferase [Providencia rustigianii]